MSDRMTTFEPGNFSFIRNKSYRAELEDMFNAIDAADAWEEIRADPAKGGFLFGAQKLTARIAGHLKNPDVHSGASFASAMRVMQTIVVDGWETWVRQTRAEDEKLHNVLLKAVQTNDQTMLASLNRFAEIGANPFRLCEHGIEIFSCSGCRY
jgi:hypothetical protein